MDDQSQGSEVQQPQAAPPVSPPPSGIQPERQQKILQPSSAFVEEMKSSAATPPSKPTPPPEVSQPATPPTTPTPAEPGASVATPSNPVPVPSGNEPAKADPSTSDKTKPVIVIVILFGAYTVGTALLDLVGGFRALSFGFVGAGGIVSLIDILYLVVGAGLILRKELARITYVFLAIFALILSILGTFKFLAALAANHFVLRAGSTPLPMLEGYAIAILALVFLTRSSVKKVFN